MSKSLKIILSIAGGLVGLLILVVLGLLFFVDAEVYKPRLEAHLSHAFGTEVKVEGRVGISVFPGGVVTLQEIHIRNRGAELATIAEARLGVDLLALLRKELRIGTISLQQPKIFIERDRAGQFNFERPEAARRGNRPPVNLGEVVLSDATLSYLDQQSGEGFAAKDCSLAVHQLRLPQGDSSELMQAHSFTADLACGEIRGSDLTGSALKVSIVAENGVFDLQPLTLQLFGAPGSGTIHADFSGKVPRYSVRYSLSQFPIEEVFKALSPQKVAQGRMDFSADLSMQGQSVKQLRQTVAGEISLRGQNLILNGRDLDQEFSRFESSQHFNLVDVGAFFFAGPLGLVVTKGYNFASIFQGSEGSSEIRALTSDWKVERGVAQAQDVALATKGYRVALQGGLDFVHEQFQDVTVALLDTEGCATVRQSIRGGFQNPVVDQPNVLKSLTGPVQKLYKMGRDLFPGGECEVFYAGSVAAPK